VNLNEEALLVFNPCSWVRTDTVTVPWTGETTNLRLRDPTGQEVELQVVATEDGTEIVFTAEEVPALGYRAYSVVTTQAPAALTQVTGDYGPLTMLLNDPGVTHIQVQSPFQVFAERGGKLEVVAERFRDEAHVRAVADRLAELIGAVLDEAHPEFDQLWPDGTRVRAQIPPQSLRGTVITIWKKEENLVAGLERRHAALKRAIRERRSLFKVNPRRLENDFFRLTLNDYGQIIDLYDKREGRGVFPPHTPGNVLQVIAGNGPAASLECGGLCRRAEAEASALQRGNGPAASLECGGLCRRAEAEASALQRGNGPASVPYVEPGEVITRLVSAEARETGPERGVVELTWRYRASTIRQRVTMYRAVPRIDFVTEVDWREWQERVRERPGVRSLQVVFPVDIHATQATYEIQFGNVVRPTHCNTGGGRGGWAQKWVDLSEGDYGVSLLNDGRYEYAVYDHVLRLTLAGECRVPSAECRVPSEPSAECQSPDSDKSQIANRKSQIANPRFTYSLYPHPEDWSRGGTTRQAYQLNYPLLVRREPAHIGNLPASHSFVSVDADHVIIETIKRAEDDASWVVRVYDYANRRGPVTLTFCEPIARAAECNLVERDEQPLKPRGRTLEFEIRPYEVKTFKVRLA
jgi:hypothetical protein